MEHKLAFLGPARVHEAFQGMDDNWDMQIPLESLDDFERELSLPDDIAQISKDTSVIIFFSRLFNSDPDKFAELVAFSAPYSVACILIPSADLDKKDTIQKAVKAAQIRQAKDYPELDPNTPFFFVLYENAQEEIFGAIEEFVKSPVVLEEVRDAIRPMLPAMDIPFEDQYEDFGYEETDDTITIPEIPKGATGEVIAVTSSKGGSGKSTVAVGLGAYIRAASKDAVNKGLTDKPLSVVIIDLDVRDGQLGFINGALRPTVVDILYEGEPTPTNIEKGVFHSTKMDVDFIFAAKRPKNAKEIPPSFYAQMIQNLRAMYDIIILDTSVNYLDPLLEDVAYPIANKIILVSDMGISSIFGASRWINETLFAPDREGVPIDKNKVGIVINKAMQGMNMGPNKIEKAVKGLPVISMIPSAPQTITYAANTNELQQILNIKHINESFQRIAEAVISSPLGEVPYVK